MQDLPPKASCDPLPNEHLRSNCVSLRLVRLPVHERERDAEPQRGHGGDQPERHAEDPQCPPEPRERLLVQAEVGRSREVAPVGDGLVSADPLHVGEP